MRVVLFQSVPNLGLAGEVVDVKPGYFRNYLEPRGYALLESPETLRLLASKKLKIEQALLKEKSQAEEARGALDGVTLTFELKAGEKGRLFGSVTNRDIAEALHRRSIEVDRHKIELGEPIKTVGSHKARVRLHPEVVAELTIIVQADTKEVPVGAADSSEKASPASEPVVADDSGGEEAAAKES